MCAYKHATSVGMYLRTTQRRNKDGSVVRYYALAENVRHPEKGYVEAKVVHSFGRADQLDRAALERLVASIQRGSLPMRAADLSVAREPARVALRSRPASSSGSCMWRKHSGPSSASAR